MIETDKKNKELIQGILIYGIGTFGTKILTFLIVPIYTYYIPTEDMGLYDLLISTINLLSPLITFQISDAAYRWMLKKEDKIIYIQSTLQVLFLNCILISFFILGINKKYRIPYCIFFVFLLVTSRCLETIQKLLRGLKNKKLYAFSGIIYTLIFLTLNILQICYLKIGIEAFFSSAIVANIITCSIVVNLEKRLRVNIFIYPNFEIIKKMLKFSLPLITNQLNWWIMNFFDRYIVSIFLGISANGILSITHKFPSMLQVVISLFTNSWQDISINDSKIDIGEYYSNIFRKFYKTCFSILWLLVPITNIVIKLIMNVDYKVSADYVAFYYLGTVFQGFSAFYGVGYLRNKQTNKAFSTSILGAIINTIVHLILIKFIGLQASAVSTFFGFFTMWIVREKHNREELGVIIDKKSFCVYFIITFLMCWISSINNVFYNLILSIWGIIAFLWVNYNDLLLIIKNIIRYLKKN